jgi:hypothetical protein
MTRFFRLWFLAMRLEGYVRNPLSFAAKCFSLLMLVVNSPLAGRALWRARMRSCMRCPIFLPTTYQCRNRELGCGCSMPMKALLLDSKCWAKEEGIANIGWREGL